MVPTTPATPFHSAESVTLLVLHVVDKLYLVSRDEEMWLAFSILFAVV